MSIFFLLRILKSICDMYINSETVCSISARVCAKQYFYLCTTPHLDVQDFKKAYFLNFYFFSSRSDMQLVIDFSAWDINTAKGSEIWVVHSAYRLG